MLRSTVLLFILINRSIAQVPFIGKCPDYEVIPNFDATKYAGKWYEAERFFAVFEFGGKCVTAEYTLSDNGTVIVENKQISAITGMDAEIQGVAALADPSGKAKLTVTFPTLPVQFGAPYWVLDTDYNSYSVVWSCVELGIFSTKNAWILTRDRFPSAETLQAAHATVERFAINREYFIHTDQVNCPDNH